MKFLTNLLLTLLCVSVFSVVNAQTFNKPRYLRFATPACPVDISKQLAYEGLLKANPRTVRVFDTVRMEIAKSDVKIKGREDKLFIQKNDTTLTSVRDTALLLSFVFNRGMAFDVVQQIGSYSLIKFWSPSEKTISSDIKNTYDDVYGKILNAIPDNSLIERIVMKLPRQSNNSKDTTIDFDFSRNFYIVPTNIIANNSVEFESKYKQWNVGILVLPVKVRPFATESGNFDFLDGFSLGTSFSFNFDHKWVQDRSTSIVFYAGLSSFTADSAKIKESRQDYKITAFSPAIGFMREKSGVQVCAMLGMDFPVGTIQKKWVYRNMPWISIGLGFSIFKISNNDANKTGKND